MENTKAIEENDSLLHDLDESVLNDTENEVSCALIYGRSLESPILGNFYRIPDIPTKYVEPTVLDTSLPYIPVYTHLKMYDLKPIERPTTPSILAELRLKCRYRNDIESCRSSKASPSTGRTSKGRSSITLKSRESERNLKTKQKV